MTKIIYYKNKTKYLDLIKNNLLNNNLVIFPTETVYGIGANALSKEAVNKIFKAKGRQTDNPLIVHISNFDMLKNITTDINEIEQKLIDAFMPGPFTLILKKTNKIPTNVSANLDTVGIRFPDNEIARKIIEYANIPIAAPSANISSKPSGTNIKDIKKEFKNKVNIIVDGGPSKIGIESTVVKVIDDIPTILRPGKITPEDIKEVIGIVKIDDNIYKKATGIVASPGMKYKHYAPDAKCILIYNEDNNKLIKLIDKHKNKKTIIIGCEENKKIFKNYLSYGNKNNLDKISHNIFHLLRKADKKNIDLIIIEGVKKEGLGIAIMNRLIRTCNYNYIEK